MSRIDVIGIGADGLAGLQPELIDRIRQADFLAGGERHLSYVPSACGEKFVVKDNLAQLVEEIGKRFPRQRCVVLASGDPLFYGIGTYLAGALGRDKVRIEPALSSMQLAFARAGLPWQDAALASVHGRDARAQLLPLLGQPSIGLFTQDGESPATVARFFLRYGLDGYEATVAENLGADDERVTRCANLTELARQSFGALNYLVLRRTDFAFRWDEIRRRRALVPGAPDDAFVQPEEQRAVMTRQEVRAVLLGKMSTPAEPGATVWDIGAGLGTVAVEIAVLRPHAEVLAVEQDPVRAGYLRQNRERFGAYNVRVIEGTAPEVLWPEAERPRVVFIGGSGARLGDILETAAARLVDGGRLLANFVTLDHLMGIIDRLRRWDWPFEVTAVQVARSDLLGGAIGLKPLRAVFIVAATKPEGGRA